MEAGFGLLSFLSGDVKYVSEITGDDGNFGILYLTPHSVYVFVTTFNLTIGSQQSPCFCTVGL